MRDVAKATVIFDMNALHVALPAVADGNDLLHDELTNCRICHTDDSRHQEIVDLRICGCRTSFEDRLDGRAAAQGFRYTCPSSLQTRIPITIARRIEIHGSSAINVQLTVINDTNTKSNTRSSA